jgi:D-ribose pyranase
MEMSGMKKTQLLNSEISEVVARMGHTDLLVIGDSGLPIHDGVKRIDLALTKGIPSFRDTLYTVLTELEVEKMYLSKDIIEKNNDLYVELCDKFKDKIVLMDHTEFKKMTAGAKASIRTGEFKPFANVILQAGVAFEV